MITWGRSVLSSVPVPPPYALSSPVLISSPSRLSLNLLLAVDAVVDAEVDAVAVDAVVDHVQMPHKRATIRPTPA